MFGFVFYHPLKIDSITKLKFGQNEEFLTFSLDTIRTLLILSKTIEIKLSNKLINFKITFN